MSFRSRRARCAAALLGLAIVGAAFAHDFTITDVLVVLREDGRFQIDMTIDVDALALGVPPSSDSAATAAAVRALAPAEFEVAEARAMETIQRRVRIRFDETKVIPDVSFPEYETSHAANAAIPTVFGITARLTGHVPENASAFTFGASASFNAVRLTILEQSTTAGTRYLLGPSEDSPPYRLNAPPPSPDRFEVARQYLVLGYEHIVPKGVDHILFVLGLFLLSTRLRPLLWQVTTFTVAHTLTLALSMLGVVSLPSAVVEPLIALSIAYVAIENLFTQELTIWRPALVFAFGLLHGLGFAGVLTNLGLPREEFVAGLVSFNAGVEGGQLSVIAAAWLLVGWFRKRKWYRWTIVIPASSAIALMGLIWAVQRTLSSF